MLQRRTLLLVTGFVVATAMYARALDNSFRRDDFGFLHHVTRVASPADLLRSSSDFAFYRPGALALFWVEYQLFGLWGGGYLTFNYLLHVANTLVMWLVLRRLSLGASASGVAALLFLLGVGHYGKQVLWACASGALLSVTASLLACWLVLRHDGRETSGLSTTRLRASVWAMSLLAMACHESGVLTPVLVALLARGRWIRWREMLLLSVPSLIWLVLLGSLTQHHPAYGRAPLGLLLSPLYVLRYPGFMLLPIPPQLTPRALPAQLVLAAAMLATATALLLQRRSTTAKVLVGWFYVALLPYGLITLPDWGLELRYLYFAAMPFCALLGLALVCARRRAHAATYRLAVAACCVLVIGSIALQLYIERFVDELSHAEDSTRRLEELRRGLP